MQRKFDPLDNLLARFDELDSASKANLISRLARERKLLSGIFNTLREGILVIEANGLVEYANPASADMLGFTNADVGSLTLWKAVPDLARTLNINHAGNLYEVANVTREFELTYPEKRIVRLYIVPFNVEETEEQSEIARYAVILSDITQDKSRNQEEIESERVNSILQLAAGVAHELGNPLNSLHIHLQVMRRQIQRLEQSPEVDKLMHSLEICSGEVDRLDSIITHFLEAVRPAQPDLGKLDIIGPLEESIEFLGPELESAGIRVDVEVEGNLPSILADRSQVKQVFYNILKNARQAMKSGGVIRVRAFNDDEFVYIQVGDTGEGIDPENLRRVFQPYYSTKKKGHGLGMMIVDRIMRNHGGQIGIDSRKGTGTLVTLQFPQRHRRVRLLESGNNEEDTD